MTKKNKNTTINPALINLLSKLSLRIYFDNLPSTFKTLYHSSPRIFIKCIVDRHITKDTVKIKATEFANIIDDNLKNIKLPYGLSFDDLYYLNHIRYMAEDQLLRTVMHKDINVNYKKKHIILEHLKLFKNKLDEKVNEIKIHAEFEFCRAVDPIVSQIKLTKDSYYYSILKVNHKTVELVIRYNQVLPKSVNEGELKRAAYPVIDLFNQKPSIVTVDKNIIENAIPLPIYIQNHALHRLNDRLGKQFSDHLYENILISCAKQEFTKASSHTYLLAFRSNGDKLGYFTVTVETNIALIRSFKFITMVGTPEYNRLKKYIPTGSEIWQYLNLDTFDTIIESDIKNNVELFAIFDKCGLGHLFEHSKGNNISIANILLPYITNH